MVPFKEEEEGTSIASNVVKVQGEDCHGTLQGRGRVRVMDSNRLLLYGETVLLRLHEIIGFI